MWDVGLLNEYKMLDISAKEVGAKTSLIEIDISINLAKSGWKLSKVWPAQSQGPIFVGRVNILRPRQNCHHLAATFSNAFSWMKMHEFHLRFHWNLTFKLSIWKPDQFIWCVLHVPSSKGPVMWGFHFVFLVVWNRWTNSRVANNLKLNDRYCNDIG